jgi:poly(hydroxyalkanoate) depolymerase family esterase
MRHALLAIPLLFAATPAHAALTRVIDFGANPGALDMYYYAPADLPDGAPLVLVLHGCSQTASSMEATGWNDLADEFGFAVVYPEQRTDNNPIRCFNWAGEYGDPANLVRGQGENQSIMSMIDYMIDELGVDAGRVFVDGFSAGGAFAAVMLATWPDRIRAGAILSGIPYRCATDVDTAYDCQQLDQNPHLGRSPAQWGDLVRAAHPGYAGPRPRVQIWHGATDFIVADENLVELVEQWTDVHGTDATADATEELTGIERAEYRDGGAVVVETFHVAGMGHAVCVGPDDPVHPCGPIAGAYYENKGTCSTWRVAEFFGLTGTGPVGDDTTPPTVDVISPAAGAAVAGTVTVIVAATDDVGVDRVELRVDGVAVATDDAAPFQLTWTASVAGEHALAATAWDAAGNQATDDDTTVTVTAGGAGGGGDDAPGGVADDELPSCGGLDAGGGGAGGLVLAAIAAAALRRSRSRRRR